MDLLMKSQNSSTRKGPCKLGKQTRTHKMEVEKKKKYHLQNAFPREVGQAATNWERGELTIPKMSLKGQVLSPLRQNWKLFETISQQRQTWC